jgi:hypothetical protein
MSPQQNGKDPLEGLGPVAATSAPDPLASLGPVAATSAPAAVEPEPTTLGGQIKKGVRDSQLGQAFKPPESPSEQLIHAVGGQSPAGGDAALAAYRAAKGVVDAGKNLVAALPAEYEQTKSAFSKAIDEFHNGNYGKAADAVIASPVAEAALPGLTNARENINGINKGNVVTPLVRQTIDAGTNAALALAGGEGANAAEDAAVAAPSKIRINPFRNPAPELGEAAVRAGVDTVTDAHNLPSVPSTRPILSGSQTILDEPLAGLRSKEAAAYKRLDDAAGFDLKAAKDQLKLDQRAVKQPGTTPADLKAIQARIADNSDHIAQAEKNLTDQGIDPKEGDKLHTARMAGQDFKNKLVQSTSDDGITSVDKLLPKLKQLRFSPRGDRLAHFFGSSEAADGFMADLQQAQKNGIAAVRNQQIAKMVLKYMPHALTAAAGAGGLIYEATH